MAPAPSSGLVVIGRLFSLLIGPGLLFILAAAISQDASGWITLKNGAFLLVLGGVLLGRLLEFRGGDPRTATGEPATATHLRQFCIQASTLGVGVWIAANLIAQMSSAR